MRIRDLLLRNLPAKILSLFLAIVLWGVVIGEKKAQIQLSVPLELVNIPERAVLVSDVPANISVVVQGPRTLLRGLPGRGIRKSIDLKGMGMGWTMVRILPDSIPLPRGIEVVRVTPSTVSVKLEPLVAVKLPVAPQLVGEPPKGYQIESVHLDPPEVVLKGGEGELGDRREVKTYPVTLSRRTTDLEERMGLDLEGLHLVEVSPSAIWVRVKIAPTLLERAMKEVPVRFIPQGRSASIKPDKVEVLLKGPMQIIDTIKETDIKVVVDLEGLAPGVHHVAPKVKAPKGLRVLKVVPPILEVALDAHRGSSDS